MTHIHHRAADFRHAALFYAGADEFVRSCAAFVRAGLEAEEPVLAMVPGRKTELLREELGRDAREVEFADMAEIGANPARIISAWRDFVETRAEPGRRLRGIGEPIWAGRSPAELVECQRHESLLNVAFADGAPMDLLCPYDERTLDGAVIEEALRSHPVVAREDGAFDGNAGYRGLEDSAAPLGAPLPPPPQSASELGFDASNLHELRGFVTRSAADAGLTPARRDDMVIATGELANNSVRHGGGRGLLRLWEEADALVAEVSDRGKIEQPLAGREPPRPDQLGGHGLWLVNNVCDLMQIRTYPTGSVVRVRVRRA